MLETLFPNEVIVVVASKEAYDEKLFIEEYESVKNSNLVRRREFAAGRACARAGLRSFGKFDKPIIRRFDGLPIWPSEYTGSITHCSGFCAAAVAKKGSITAIGIDAEPIVKMDDGLWEILCSEREKQIYRNTNPYNRQIWLLLTFVAKEAFYKAYYQEFGRFLEFADVEISLSSVPHRDKGIFSVLKINGDTSQAADRVFGRWVRYGDFLIAGAYLTK